MLVQNMALSEQEVFAAADQIRESGRVPSAINIREITQVGSLGTIQKHLRKWRHRETVSAASSNPPPEQVLNSIRQFGEQLWQLALQQAEKAASVKVRQARDDQDEAQRDTDEVMSRLETLQEQFDKIQAKLQLEKESKEKILKENEVFFQEHAVLKEEVSEGKHQLERTRDQLKGQEEKTSQLTLSVDQLNKKVNAGEELLKDKQSQIANLQKEEAVLKSQLENLTNLNNKIVFENKDLSLKNELVYQKCQKQELQLNHLKVLEENFDESKKLLNQRQDEVRRLSIELESEKQVNRRFENLINRLQPTVLPS